MATLNARRTNPVSSTLVANFNDQIIAYLGDIAVGNAPAASAEDALTVLNRKIESGEMKAVWSNAATDSPSSPSVTWNYQTGVFTVSTSGGWSTSKQADARFYALIVTPKDSNTTEQLNIWRVDGLLGVDIGYTPMNTNATFLPASIDNVDEAIDALDTQVKTLTDRPVGGATSPQAISWNSTSGWRITDKPDLVPYQDGEFIRINGALDTTGITREITLDSELVTKRSRFGIAYFIEAFAQVRTQGSVGLILPVPTETFVFDLIDSNNVVVLTSASGTITVSDSEQSRNFRFSGNLPADFTTGDLRVRRTGTTGTAPPPAWIDHMRYEIRPDTNADEIIVKRTDLGKVLKDDAVNNIENMDDVVEQVNNLPLQPTEFGTVDDFTISAGSTTPQSHALPVPRLVQELNAREGHHVRLRVSYLAEVVRDSGLGGPRENLATWNVQILRNNAGANVLTSGNSFTDQANSQGEVRRTHTWTLTAGTTSSQIIMTIPQANDADVAISDFEYDYQELISSSSSSASNVTTDVSAFNGLLSATDTNMQLVANTLDDVNATDIPLTVNQFDDPNFFPGGLRQPLPTGTIVPNYNANPTTVQQGLRNADYWLQQSYWPFRSIETIDFQSGGGFSGSTTVNSSSAVLSEAIDIPEELRDLSSDVTAIVRIRVQSIGSGWVGNVQLVNEANTMTFGDPEAVNTTVYSAGDYVQFYRTLSAPVTNTYRVRFTRTGGTTAATFDRGRTFAADRLAGAGGAGARGSTEAYQSSIIYNAGPTINDRLTQRSESINRELNAGQNFSDWNEFEFVFDAGAGAQPIMPCRVTADTFRGNGANGTLWIQGSYWLMVSYQVDASRNKFRWRWGSAVNGLRRIIGINTAATT